MKRNLHINMKEKWPLEYKRDIYDRINMQPQKSFFKEKCVNQQEDTTIFIVYISMSNLSNMGKTGKFKINAWIFQKLYLKTESSHYSIFYNC